MLFFFRNNYQRSKRLKKVHITIPPLALVAMQQLLQSSTATDREYLGQYLLNLLSEAVGIPPANLTISDKNQYHRRRGGRITMKQYGYYRPASNYIYITNRTAVRGQVLASRTFINTLLHEWLHHYETHKLRLNSVHTSGFYLRLRDLSTKLGLAPQKK